YEEPGGVSLPAPCLVLGAACTERPGAPPPAVGTSHHPPSSRLWCEFAYQDMRPRPKTSTSATRGRVIGVVRRSQRPRRRHAPGALLVGGGLLRGRHEGFQFGHHAGGGLVMSPELCQVLQVPA